MGTPGARETSAMPLASGWSERSVPGVVESGVALRMPVEFTAFCLLHQERYLRYCRVRLQESAVAVAVVEQTLGDLAVRWPAALASSPAALAWRLLSRRAGDASSTGCAKAGVAALYRVLPVVQADAVVLCRILALSVQEAAAMTGAAVADVMGHLAAVERRLPASATDELVSSSRPRSC